MLIKLLLSVLFLSISLASLAAPAHREISVIFSEEGYYPKSLSVFEGEKIRFFVTSTTDRAHCFIVESHKVFLSAEKGKISEVEVHFDRPGSFSFYCPSAKGDGRIVVLPKKKKELTRNIASEKQDPMLWVPKDEVKEVGIYE